MNNKRWLFVLMVMGVLCSVSGGRCLAAESLLDVNGDWRCYYVLRDPVIGTTKDGAHPISVNKKTGYRFNTPKPSSDWNATGYDDTGWMLQQGPFFPGYGFGDQLELSVIYLRGSFDVIDPAKISNLRVNASFRGGLVVYLNGSEITRSHMPKGGITVDTLALDYPWTAYTSQDNKLLDKKRDPRKNTERCASHIRNMNNIEIPVNLLKKGRNVVAIEVHRTPIHPDAYKHKKWKKNQWSSVGLQKFACTAEQSEGALSRKLGMKDMRMWNASPMHPVHVLHNGDAYGELRPIRLAGTRNGSFSGQIVVRSTNPMTTAQVTNLKQRDGKGVIPKSSIEIRYALPTGSNGNKRLKAGDGIFDALGISPRTEGVVHPVWITVTVPKDSEPGEYIGILTVAGRDIPIHLMVSGWVLPDPQDFVTWVDLVESPESVALQYKTPLWSDAHIKKLDSCFAQLAKLGNKTLYIPLAGHSNFGNAETMVR